MASAAVAEVTGRIRGTLADYAEEGEGERVLAAVLSDIIGQLEDVEPGHGDEFDTGIAALRELIAEIGRDRAAGHDGRYTLRRLVEVAA